MSDRYWLLDWMDENGVKSDWHVDKVLKSKARLKHLRDTAEATPYTTEALAGSARSESILVGGRGIDLSGDLECSNWECKKRQVDRLFSRVWHYFDKVVVVGFPAHELHKEERLANDQVVAEVRETMRLLLYLRKIGAEDMLIFRQKPPACEIHSGEQLAKAGFPDPTNVVSKLAKQIEAQGSLRGVREHGNHFHFVLDHDTFMHSAFETVTTDEISEHGSLESAAAYRVVSMYVSRLSSDVLAAKYLSNPFGSDLEYYGVLLREFSAAVTHTDVALEMQLPVLDGVSPADILALRAAEGESFQRFRAALKTAIHARLDAAGTATAEQIAREIEIDVLSPALADIGLRLRAAQATLSKKAVLGLGIGALATTCGLALGVPPLAVAGVGAAMAALQAEYKYIEERNQIKLDQMYFLWKASHAH
jgi:hypothetical protein